MLSAEDEKAVRKGQQEKGNWNEKRAGEFHIETEFHSKRQCAMQVKNQAVVGLGSFSGISARKTHCSNGANRLTSC
jgi:hypothetical protein